MFYEFIIFGHSNTPSGYIKCPRNCTIVFHAKKNETCFLPNTLVYLNDAYISMKEYPQQYNSMIYGNRIPNHNIIFNNNLHGLLLIENGEINNLCDPGNYNLKNLIEIAENYSNKNNFTVYCMFCRGEKNNFNNILKGKNFGLNPNTNPTLNNNRGSKDKKQILDETLKDNKTKDKNPKNKKT